MRRRAIFMFAGFVVGAGFTCGYLMALAVH
jgi:hypothetical protein